MKLKFNKEETPITTAKGIAKIFVRISIQHNSVNW